MVINIWGAKQKQLGWGSGHQHADLYPSFVFRMMPPPSAGPGVLSPESLLFNLSMEGNSRHQLGREMGWESKILAVPSKRFSYFSHTCTPPFQRSQVTPISEPYGALQHQSVHFPALSLMAFICFPVFKFAVLIHFPTLFFSWVCLLFHYFNGTSGGSANKCVFNLPLQLKILSPCPFSFSPPPAPSAYLSSSSPHLLPNQYSFFPLRERGKKGTEAEFS